MAAPRPTLRRALITTPLLRVMGSKSASEPASLCLHWSCFESLNGQGNNGWHVPWWSFVLLTLALLKLPLVGCQLAAVPVVSAHKMTFAFSFVVRAVMCSADSFKESHHDIIADCAKLS
jgi:hypothetical protein